MAYTRVKTWAAGEVLTHTDLNAEFDAVQADANAKDGADLNAGTVTTTRLASPNAYYTLEVTCHSDADALGTGVLATAQPGLADNLTTADFPFDLEVASTLIGITTCCGTANAAGGARQNSATVRQNGANLSATTTQFVSTAATTTTGLSLSLATTDTLLIRCATDNAATDGVARARVILHLVALHRT